VALYNIEGMQQICYFTDSARAYCKVIYSQFTIRLYGQLYSCDSWFILNIQWNVLKFLSNIYKNILYKISIYIKNFHFSLKKCVAWPQVNYLWTFSKYIAFIQKILLRNWKTYQKLSWFQKIKTCSDCDTNQNDFKLTLSSLQILQEIIISP
jgi:hypothetical protein